MCAEILENYLILFYGKNLVSGKIREIDKKKFFKKIIKQDNDDLDAIFYKVFERRNNYDLIFFYFKPILLSILNFFLKKFSNLLQEIFLRMHLFQGEAVEGINNYSTSIFTASHLPFPLNKSFTFLIIF